MKVRTARRSRNVVVEMGREEAGLPPIALPELSLKRILVPVDFSEPSRKALHYAVPFAKQFNAELILIHVLESVPMEGQAISSGPHEKAAKELSEWRHQIDLQATVKAVVAEGISAHEAIVDAARESNVDLIIVGTKGRTGLSHLLLGSTAERVARFAPCPVMVVREHQHDFVKPEIASSNIHTRKE